MNTMSKEEFFEYYHNIQEDMYEWEERTRQYPRVLGYTIDGKAVVQLGEENKGTYLYVDEIAEDDYPQHFKEQVKTGWEKAKDKL